VTDAKKKTPLFKTSARKKKPATGRKTKNGFSKWRLIAIAVLVLVLLSPFYYGYILKNVVGAWSWIKNIRSNPHYRTYKNFNIRIPDKYPVQGIDVSSYQGYINWEKVKKMHQDSIHIGFAFIKATEGVIKADPFFQRNWRECKKAGIPCGAYHYLWPRFSGKFQAKFFLQNIKPGKGDLPVVVDIETLEGVTPAKMRLQLAEFLREIETRTKVKPIIYSGVKFYEDNLAGYFDDYPLWLSNFNHSDLVTGRSTHWKFWQHSDKARVNGIAHAVDFDAFKGDSIAFKRMLIP
jgi:lysozyme